MELYIFSRGTGSSVQCDDNCRTSSLSRYFFANTIPVNTSLETETLSFLNMGSSFSSNNQLSPLATQRQFVTSHNNDAKAIVHSAGCFQSQAYDGNQMAFSVVYSTSRFPVELNGYADIQAHDTLMQKGLGLVNPGGTVLRCVDFAPGYQCGMHRTQSLDYGIVLEGEVDMLLDAGEAHSMKAGDVAVQRATNHQWRNTSSTKWVFVLQDCEPLEIQGKNPWRGSRQGPSLFATKPPVIPILIIILKLCYYGFGCLFVFFFLPSMFKLLKLSSTILWKSKLDLMKIY
jgi:quercetin dioxygenase-like cupin family protein